METNQLYNVPNNLIAVVAVVFQILTAHWKTIGRLVVYQFFAVLGTLLTLALVTYTFTKTYINAIHNHISNAMDDSSGFGRALFDSSVGVSGASRLLQKSNYNDDDVFNSSSNREEYPFVDRNTILMAVVFYLIWVVGYSLVLSVFVGAYNHALASIYGGIVPNVRRGLSHGVEKMCPVFFYLMLYTFAITFILLLTIGLVLIGGGTGLFFGCIFGLLTWVIFAGLMTAAIPSIVIEKKSAVQAFGRSFNLCTSFFGFTVCTRAVFHLFVIVVSMIMNRIFDLMPMVLSLVGHTLVSAFSQALEPILAFVIYMNIRIQKELITSEDIVNEIGNGEEVATDAVELSDNASFAYRDNKGPYANVSAEERSGMI